MAPLVRVDALSDADRGTIKLLYSLPAGHSPLNAVSTSFHGNTLLCAPLACLRSPRRAARGLRHPGQGSAAHARAHRLASHRFARRDQERSAERGHGLDAVRQRPEHRGGEAQVAASRRSSSTKLSRESDIDAMKEERAAVVARINELVARLDSSEKRVASLRARAASSRQARLDDRRPGRGVREDDRRSAPDRRDSRRRSTRRRSRSRPCRSRAHVQGRHGDEGQRPAGRREAPRSPTRSRS